MEKRSTGDGRGTVAILASDDAARAALVFTFEVMNYDTVAAESFGRIPPDMLRSSSTVVVDCTLITPAEAIMFSKLRDGGWTGTLIVMAEDETGCGAVSQDKYQARILVKPFGLDDLVAAMAHSSRGAPQVAT